MSGKLGRCYESHPPLKFAGHKIFGGSCINPVVKDSDVYIGFDFGMKFTPRSYPWNKGEEILFRITDTSVPKDKEEFDKLLAFTKESLEKGLKVHAGCIGGHGRTGLFFAALINFMGVDIEDTISYVRENYCEKVVESRAQVDWLVKHYGAKKVKASKMYSTIPHAKPWSHATSETKAPTDKTTGVPVWVPRNIWGIKK
jgi:hypothetical protein